MKYNYITYSNKGKRAQNEDNYFPQKGQKHNNLFFVCDGIGGHGNGDLASAFVAQQLPTHLPNNLESAKSIELAIHKTDTHLKSYARQMGNDRMGSTIAMLKLQNDHAWIGWVGDSRVYHIRNRQILFRSKDHSLLQLLLDSEGLSAEEADTYPMKNIIYQALGPKGTRLCPSVEKIEGIQHEDVFLLASDGVFEAWDEMDLAYRTHQKIDNLATELYDRCLKLSKDNFTFTLVKALSH